MEFDPYWQNPQMTYETKPIILPYKHIYPCYNGDYHMYRSILWIQGQECGSFTIGAIGGFHSGHTMTMDINIDDEHKKKGYSVRLIRTLCEFIKECRVQHEGQLLFIDTDASGGFWDHIGMIPNRYYERFTNDREGGGYEKVITFEQLCKF